MRPRHQRCRELARRLSSATARAPPSSSRWRLAAAAIATRRRQRSPTRSAFAAGPAFCIRPQPRLDPCCDTRDRRSDPPAASGWAVTAENGGGPELPRGRRFDREGGRNHGARRPGRGGTCSGGNVYTCDFSYDYAEDQRRLPELNEALAPAQSDQPEPAGTPAPAGRWQGGDRAPGPAHPSKTHPVRLPRGAARG